MQLPRFLRNQKGGVAPTLALAIIPLVGMVGAAIDYSRANSVRTSMQGALDSTALMLSKDGNCAEVMPWVRLVADWLTESFRGNRRSGTAIQWTWRLFRERRRSS